MQRTLTPRYPEQDLFFQGWEPTPLSARPGEARVSGRGTGSVYLQPFLGLLLALQCQHQDLGSPLGEAQLMPLVPAVLGHIDDTADVQRQPQVWLPVLGAFVTLGKERRGQGVL